MLPYGIYLHKKYHSARFHSVVRLKEAHFMYEGSTTTRRNMVIDQAEKIREQRRKMQSELMIEAQNRGKVPSEKVKSVPDIKVSSKLIKIEMGIGGKKKGGR